MTISIGRIIHVYGTPRSSTRRDKEMTLSSKVVVVVVV